jgi:hypothetical protein
MLHMLLLWASNTFDTTNIGAVVEIDYIDFEAIYVPPEYHGPIVAIPTDEIFLAQEVENAVSP